ncbi:cytochrome P450 3A11-like [Centruroides vittatus]|uniref:cytochrome P450 3A11-like n=1 Tax=Centruroides vittatus TaxID=120091 RepID=UPI003510A108
MMELKQFIPSTWITLIASVLVLFVIYVNRKFQYWKRQGIQCSVNGIWSFLLELSEVLKKSTHFIDLEYYKKYGRVHGRFLGNKPMICIAEPHILKNIFVKDFNTFHNRVKVETGNQLFDKSMFFTEDDDWKRIRCIVSPTFSSGKMRKMAYLVKECAEKFSENLKKIADENENNCIDCKRYMNCFTIDVMASAAFGTKLCCLEDPNNEFLTMARKATNRDISFSEMILFLFPILTKLIKVKSIDESFSYYKNFILHVINQREKEKMKAYDFLQLLLDAQKGVLEISPEEAKEEEMSNFKILPKHKTMNSVEMMAQCTGFLFAGSETTTNTLAFFLYHMALYPEYQDKLIEEVDKIWKTNDEMNFDVLNKMQYMDAVINETMRITPPLVQLFRECTEDYELPEIGIKIPKGMNIVVPIYAMHHDKKFFPNPEKFDPDRFLPENRSSIIPFTYLPFGEGPRNCIGMRFALMVIKMCLVYIFRDLRVEATEETKLPLEYFAGQGILHPKKVMIKFEKRK